MGDGVDLLVVGAGPVGCVVAERAAAVKGWRTLVVDRRGHIGGNCHDGYDKHGILVHSYGPHYFRTNSRRIHNYLSRFTEWIEGRYVANSLWRGQLFPFPINLSTLEQFFHRRLTPAAARRLLEERRDRSVAAPRNAEELLLSRIGRELYEAFYRGYTLKQWGRPPRRLDASIVARVPIRFTRDVRYVNHRLQVMPKRGYTALFARMLDHPAIEVRLDTDYSDVRGRVRPRVGTVYCGALDEYFDHRLGRLPWRSLRFRFRTYRQEFRQPCVQICYPNDFEFTRSIEIKHVTRQAHPWTAICYEYPTRVGDPFYPVLCPESRALAANYRKLAARETRARRVFFAGRLGRYAYMDMDEAIADGLATFAQLARP
jgi:UDP-galactopyranose mutase